LRFELVPYGTPTRRLGFLFGTEPALSLNVHVDLIVT
jgi:hypothetical protein